MKTDTIIDLHTPLVSARDQLEEMFPDKEILVSFSIKSSPKYLPMSEYFTVMIDGICGAGETIKGASTRAIEKIDAQKSELIRRAKELGLTVTEGAK